VSCTATSSPSARVGLVVAVTYGDGHSAPSGVAGILAGLAGLAGCVAVAGLVAAHAAWRSRRQALGLQPVQDSNGPGCWFAVPLPKGAGFRPGLITRAEPRQDGILLCYFFPPSGTAVPALDELRELRPAPAGQARIGDRSASAGTQHARSAPFCTAQQLIAKEPHPTPNGGDALWSGPVPGQMVCRNCASELASPCRPPPPGD
jgi:hypothetical protein